MLKIHHAIPGPHFYNYLLLLVLLVCNSAELLLLCLVQGMDRSVAVVLARCFLYGK